MYKVDYQNKTDQNKSRLEILAIIEALGETREIFNVLQIEVKIIHRFTIYEVTTELLAV